MAFCANCGKLMEDNAQVCPSCGASPEQKTTTNNSGPYPPNSPSDFLQKINDTPDSTSAYDPKDIADNKLMAVLSYIGIFVLIPWFAAPNSKFARFHAKQGLTLLILYIAYFIVSFLLGLIKTTQYLWGIPYQATPGIIVFITWVIGIPLFILSIIGIINAVQGKAKELPLIGKLKWIK